jgi:anti-sigma regulatory factor (Ser/Thr protein kinase)
VACWRDGGSLIFGGRLVKPVLKLPAALDLSRFPHPPLSSVRLWVTEVLVGTSEECVDDAVLLVNELVSNVYDHATPPCRVRVSELPERHGVRVEVDDGEADLLPVMGTSRLGKYRGRGLVLVERVAERWGISRRTWGKTVWAELAYRGGRPLRVV